MGENKKMDTKKTLKVVFDRSYDSPAVIAALNANQNKCFVLESFE